MEVGLLRFSLLQRFCLISTPCFFVDSACFLLRSSLKQEVAAENEVSGQTPEEKPKDPEVEKVKHRQVSLACLREVMTNAILGCMQYRAEEWKLLVGGDQLVLL